MSTSPYSPAAKILNEIWTKRKGLKTIVYSQNGELKCSKTTYAQCSQVLKHYPLLKQLLQDDNNNNTKEDGITLAVAPHNQGLLYVLLYELLLGPNKAVKGGGSLKRALLQQHKALQSKLQKLQQQQHQDDDDDTTSTKTNTTTTIPRYVRINTLKTTTEQVVQELRQRLRRSDDENDNKANAKIYMDPHVPDLIVMEHTPQTRRLLQPLVETQKVILQDKSSCFSALCLVHGYSDNGSDTIGTGSGSGTGSGTGSGGHYLDACAAPGNKTSHLAALIAKASAASQSTTTTTTTTTAKKKKKKIKKKTKTIIHALDQSPDRYKLLQRRMTELTTSETEPVMVECMCQDFLKTTQDQFHNQHNKNKNKKNNEDDNDESLHGILLDPSCSGSGMTTNHLERPNQKPDFVNDRVRKLSRFQFQALHHALTAFPTVEKVVYSTCSVYQHENERVVALALQKVRRRGKDDDDDWELVAPKCLESWHRRGIPYHSTAETKRDDEDDDERGKTFVRLSKDQARCLIRVHPDQDGTNGFFVACFQKKKQSIHKDSAKDWKKPELPSGIEYYNGQFQKETTNQPQLESDSTASSQTTKKRSSSTAAITEDENKVSQSQQKKPKMVGDDTKMNKKRAKRMEWKRKQREQKAARLQKRKLQKQNRQSVTTTP